MLVHKGMHQGIHKGIILKGMSKISWRIRSMWVVFMRIGIHYTQKHNRSLQDQSPKRSKHIQQLYTEHGNPCETDEIHMCVEI